VSYAIKHFQKQYALSNKEMAEICKCSLPTIQKWRSGEVNVSGAAGQLLTMLDLSAEGDPAQLRDILGRLDHKVAEGITIPETNLDQLESSMNQVVDRLELMLEGRRKQKELAASEARYRSMLQSYSIPACRWLPDTTLTFVNDAYSALYRQFGEELVGRKWIDLLPVDRRMAAEAIISDMVRRGEEETSTHEFVGPDGQSRFFEWRDVPVKNEMGEVLELHSIAHEVTELVALRSEVQSFRGLRNTLLDISDLPVLIFDGSGKFQEMNEAFRLELLQDHDWHTLAQMMSGKVSGKLNRLLKRLSKNEEVCFQVLLRDSIHLMKIRLLVKSGKDTQFLSVFERLERVEENPVMHVRFQHEVILEGEKRGFLMEKERMEGVQEAMEILGRTVHGDRIYVFTFDFVEEVFDNVLEWCADGVTPHINDLQRIPMDVYPWWMQRLNNQQWITVENTLKMPRSAAKEKEILIAQDISSVLAAPLVVENKTVGFVGIDHNHSTRIWHDQEKKELECFKSRIEQLLAEMLANHGTS
jgi:PAS domain S-box-containing protein